MLLQKLVEYSHRDPDLLPAGYNNERVRYWIRDDTWVRAKWRLGLINNYDRFRTTAPSELPQVRTLARDYATTARFTPR